MNGGLLEVSVVICAYTLDRWDDLKAAVESVQHQTTPPLEIIVVVDHNPRLLTRAQAEIPDIVVMENREQRGLSGARNSGIAVARGQIIAFMDEDAAAAPDWLERLRAGYTSDAVVGVGGAIEAQWMEARPRWFPEEFNWVVGCTYRGMPDTVSPVRNLIGCNMSFRREVFAVVGGFHNGIGRVGTIPVGCEETEFCIRVRQSWPQSILLFLPHAKVSHRVPASRGKWSYYRSRCYHEGRSKAFVARMVGTGDGLATERTYAFRTLPQGLLRGVVQSLYGNTAGLATAAAIMLGLVFTAVGYAVGTLSQRSILFGTARNNEVAL